MPSSLKIERRCVLARKILEQGQKGLGLNGQKINRAAILSSDKLILQFPLLSNALAHIGLIDEIKQLYNIDKNIINEVDINKWTPLHEAAREGNIDVIEFLLDNGANIDAKTTDGKTALDIATIYDRSDAVNICLTNDYKRDDSEEEEMMVDDEVNDKDEINNKDEVDDVVDYEKNTNDNDEQIKMDSTSEDDTANINNINNIEEEQPTVKPYTNQEDNPIQLFFKRIRKLLSKIKLFFAPFIK